MAQKLKVSYFFEIKPSEIDTRPIHICNPSWSSVSVDGSTTSKCQEASQNKCAGTLSSSEWARITGKDEKVAKTGEVGIRKGEKTCSVSISSPAWAGILHATNTFCDDEHIRWIQNDATPPSWAG